MRTKVTFRNKKSHFEDLLRASGFRATSGRLELLLALDRAHKPLSVDEIVGTINKRGSLDTASVYRALKELTKVHILKQVDFQHGHAHYEISDDGDHHHFVCINCGRIEDFTGCNLDSVIQAVLKKSSNFRAVTEHSLELFGLCVLCAKNED